MLMKRAVVMLVCTVVFGAHGTPLHVQMPPGTCFRVSESLSSRSSEWFSAAPSRLKKPDDSCLALLLHAFELSYPVVALPLQAKIDAYWTIPSSSPERHALAPKIAS